MSGRTLAVHGQTAPGYEQLQGILAAAACDLGDGGAAFCATVAGEVVADLWAGQATTDKPWKRDSMSCLFSATKGMTAACAMLLHHRGQLDLDAPLSEYWDGFQAPVTVRQVLSHTAGLTQVPGYAAFLRVDGTGWDDTARIRAALASATPEWQPGTAQGYHGLTYGWLIGTLVELCSGRTLRHLFEQDIAKPLGLDLRFGTDEIDLDRLTTLIDPAPLDPALQAHVDTLLAPARDPATIPGRAFLAEGGTGVLDRLAQIGNSPAAMRCGGGFGDGVGTARALASFYVALLQGWPSSAAVKTFSQVHASGHDQVLALPSAYCLGFQGNVELPTGWIFGPGTETFGHGGAGGQIGCADPEAQITIGFLRSHLSLASPVARDLIAAVYDIAGGTRPASSRT